MVIVGTPCRQLIVNADDLGLADSIDMGILEAHREGIVTSASIVATGETFEPAARRLRETPSLGVGVHLNFYRGRTLLPAAQVPTLLGPDGRLPGSWRTIVSRLLARRIDLDELEAELRAQIRRVLEAGLLPDHVDSEKHLHMWPSVYERVCGLAEEHGIPRVRVVRERPGGRIAADGLSMLSAGARTRAAALGLEASDSTVGVARPPTTLAALERALASGRGGHVEFVVHPGRVDEASIARLASMGDGLLRSRERELEVLTDPAAREAVHRCGFTLVARFDDAPAAAQVLSVERLEGGEEALLADGQGTGPVA